MKKITSLILTIVFTLSVMLVQAVPATLYPIKYTQPNGEEITIMLRGDEKVNMRYTLDGYSLMINEDRYLTYAQIDSNNDLQPSTIIATDLEQRDIKASTFLAGISKELYYSDAQVSMMNQVYDMVNNAKSSFAGSNGVGHKKLLCALVGFPNEPFQKSVKEFYNLLNQQGYNSTGSVKDYFKECSYGALELDVTVAGPYTAPENESKYANSSQGLANFLMKAVGEEYDMAEFDNDDDGYVDGFHFVFAGNGMESTGIEGTIWSHRSRLRSSITIDGKKLLDYSCSPELSGTSKTMVSTIGVVCHEMSHCFGAPDYYDTDNNGKPGGYIGTGKWDLMAQGCYNGSPSGSKPSGHNMYQKIQYGWVTPIELTKATNIYAMPNSAEHPVAYIVKTNTDKEFFVLENRQKIGLDIALSGSGLIIYRVGENAELLAKTNSINADHPQQMYPIYASSTVDIPNSEVSSYGSINSNGCPFPGSSAKTTFTDSSTPSAKSWAGENTNKSIENIAENTTSKTISFTFMGGISSDCAVPRNLVGEFVMGEGVKLSWEAPEDSTPSGYNVYRNDQLISSNIAELKYIDTDYKKIDYAYYVTANTGECQSKPSNIMNIHVTKDIYTINAECHKPEAGTVTGGGQYEKGTKVRLRVKANEDHVFLYWYVDGLAVETASLYQFTASMDMNVIAVFDEPIVISVNENSDNANIKIFASNRNINISSDDIDNANVQIIDINGRVIKNIVMTGNNARIPIEKRGMYIVRVIIDSQIITKKIVL